MEKRMCSWLSLSFRAEPVVSLLRLPKTGFRIEIDVAKHPFKLPLIAVFNCIQSRVDHLADVGGIPLVAQRLKRAGGG